MNTYLRLHLLTIGSHNKQQQLSNGIIIAYLSTSTINWCLDKSS